MQPISEDISRILDLLTQAPFRLEKATRGLEATRLDFRSDEEPWSASDILAHLRACSERIVNYEQPHLDQIESLLR